MLSLGGQYKGFIEAHGFYPLDKYDPDALWEGKELEGHVGCNTRKLREVLTGRSAYAVKSYHVDKPTYDKALQYMSTYDRRNDYGAVTNNCVHAVFSALKHAGVTNSFVQEIPGASPSAIHKAIKGGY